MPPWPADANYTHFIDEKILSQDEIDKITNMYQTANSAAEKRKETLTKTKDALTLAEQQIVDLKEKVKKLVKQLFLVYDNKKCCQLIFKFGVCAKNLRSVAESIEELTNYIKDNGLDNITEKDL